MSQKADNDCDSEMVEEYDFTGGVRGKYVDRFASGAKVVILDPDVARVFTDSQSVNEALRAIIEHQPNTVPS
jgi:hypothetical protein